MPTFGVSAGLSAEHRPPQAGDVQLEGPLKVQSGGLGLRVQGSGSSGILGIFRRLGGLGRFREFSEVFSGVFREVFTGFFRRGSGVQVLGGLGFRGF